MHACELCSYLRMFELMDNYGICTVLPRFQREFTQGVKPDWTIARIEHSKLLE